MISTVDDFVTVKAHDFNENPSRSLTTCKWAQSSTWVWPRWSGPQSRINSARSRLREYQRESQNHLQTAAKIVPKILNSVESFVMRGFEPLVAAKLSQRPFRVWRSRGRIWPLPRRRSISVLNASFSHADSVRLPPVRIDFHRYKVDQWARRAVIREKPAAQEHLVSPCVNKRGKMSQANLL